MPYIGDTTSILNTVCQNGAPKDVDGRAHDSTTVKPMRLLKRNTGNYPTGFEACGALEGSGNSGSPAIFQCDISAGNHARSNIAYDKETLFTQGDKIPSIQHERGKAYKLTMQSATVAADKYLVTAANGEVVAYALTTTPKLLHAWLTIEGVTSATEIEAIYVGEVYLNTA
jgi:hypothetical protein